MSYGQLRDSRNIDRTYLMTLNTLTSFLAHTIRCDEFGRFIMRYKDRLRFRSADNGAIYRIKGENRVLNSVLPDTVQLGCVGLDDKVLSIFELYNLVLACHFVLLDISEIESPYDWR